MLDVTASGDSIAVLVDDKQGKEDIDNQGQFVSLFFLSSFPSTN